MSVDIQKWKAEAHENAAKTVANMLQVGILSETYKLRHFVTNDQLNGIYAVGHSEIKMT